MNRAVYSPLWPNVAAKEEEKIEVDTIISAYATQFNYDVSNYFSDKSIYVYICPKTGYRFFYPFNCSGKSEFYEHFQKFEWYYMPWKWEHEIVAQYIRKDLKLLEVGCGGGGFLNKIQKDRNVRGIGLELNKESIEYGRRNHIDIRNETIQEHALLNEEKYDLVCSFEVLEHISDVKTFIQATVDTLKTGGLLSIGVPNNDSFIKLNFENNILNQPPHHMGLWNKRSLKSLTKLYPLKIKRIFYEPVQEYHKKYYVDSLNHFYEKMISKKYFFFLKYLPNFFKAAFKKIFLWTLSKQFKNGQTLVIIYEKSTN